jgi:hypothetical protein
MIKNNGPQIKMLKLLTDEERGELFDASKAFVQAVESALDVAKERGYTNKKGLKYQCKAELEGALETLPVEV